MTPLRQAGEDLRVRTLAVIAAVATIVGVGAVLVAVWLAPSAVQEVRRGFGSHEVTAGVEQQLFESEARSARIEAEARARLDTYAAGDGGLARIPIRRAVELVLDGRRPPEAGAPAFVEAP